MAAVQSKRSESQPVRASAQQLALQLIENKWFKDTVEAMHHSYYMQWLSAETNANLREQNRLESRALARLIVRLTNLAQGEDDVS